MLPTTRQDRPEGQPDESAAAAFARGSHPKVHVWYAVSTVPQGTKPWQTLRGPEDGAPASIPPPSLPPPSTPASATPAAQAFSSLRKRKQIFTAQPVPA